MTTPAWAYLVGAVCYAASVVLLAVWVHTATRKVWPPCPHPGWVRTTTGSGPSNVKRVDHPEAYL